jgi:hypothetical protein
MGKVLSQFLTPAKRYVVDRDDPQTVVGAAAATAPSRLAGSGSIEFELRPKPQQRPADGHITLNVPPEELHIPQPRAAVAFMPRLRDDPSDELTGCCPPFMPRQKNDPDDVVTSRHLAPR